MLLAVMLSMGLAGHAEETPALLPALMARTTLHGRYDPDVPLTREQINLLLKAGFSMPTGGGQRSLEFFVVTDRKIMTAMRGGNPYSQALETAPCLIVIAADHNQAIYDELQEMDAGLAAGGMLAQGAELGLATCVLSISPQQERIASVRDALNMPRSFTPILMIAVGYPQEDAITSASVHYWNEAQVHDNTYSLE